MNNYGVTEKGFRKMAYNEILENVENDLKEVFGDDLDFSEDDPLYNFTVPLVYMASEWWEMMEHVFYSASPKYAEGNNLSNLGRYIGILRKQAAPAIGQVTFTGNPGVVIPSGLNIKTNTDIVFKTTKEAVIDETKNITVGIKAIEPGSNGNVPSGTITNIVDPVIGLKTVTNKEKTYKGQDEETDIEFRRRYEQSVAQRANNTIDSITSNVMKLTGVLDTLVVENDTMAEVDNIPPKSFHAIVVGGNEQEIAQYIFDKKPAGVQAYGTTILDVKDSKGYTHKIGFSRPVTINIKANIQLIPTAGSIISNEDKEKIKTSIIDYINHLKLGQDVVIYKLISLIDKLNIDGIDDINILLAANDGELSQSNITIDKFGVARTTNELVEVK